MSTASRALAARVEALRQVTGCVSRQRLVSYPVNAATMYAEFRTPAPLQAFGALRSASITVIATIHATVGADGSWHPTGASYAYALLDRNGTEVLAFHWQPGPTHAGPDHPHLHVSAPVRFPDARGNAVLVEIDKRHLPTGPVPLTAFVRTLIEEFGIRPLAADWRSRLATADGGIG